VWGRELCWICRSEKRGKGRGVGGVGLRNEGKGRVVEMSVLGVRGREG